MPARRLRRRPGAALLPLRLSPLGVRAPNRYGAGDERRRGDTTAKVRCTLVLVATEKGEPRLVSGGWYRCKVVKQGDTWRIKEQDALLDSPF